MAGAAALLTVLLSALVPTPAHAASFEFRLLTKGLHTLTVSGSEASPPPSAPEPSLAGVWEASDWVTLNADGSATVNAPLRSVRGAQALPASGKWYWEVRADDTVYYAGYPVIGVGTVASEYPGKAVAGCGLFLYNGQNYIYANGVEIQVSDTSMTWTLGVGYDGAKREVSFYRAGQALGTCTVAGTAATYAQAGAGASIPTYPRFSLNASPSGLPAGFTALGQAPR